jgi:ubiquinone/menaquinone biosynthesis C-methylase UbiE
LAATQRPETSERNRRLFDGAFGAMYGFYMERERVSRLVGRVVWGGDTRPLYESLKGIDAVPAGGTVVDAPCGAGVSFRGLGPSDEVRYLAFDLSPAMLGRARRRAARRGLRQIELREPDVTDLPVESGSVDLFISHFGLHCLAEPQAAVVEIARCLRPGGTVVGSTIVTGRSRRQRALVRPWTGGFGAVPSSPDLERWIAAAGLDMLRIDRRGPFAYFSARPASADRR